MKIYNKSNLILKSLRENVNGFIVEKKHLTLKEENGEQDAYVEPSQQGQNLSSAISDERRNDPNATTFVANMANFDKNANNNPITLDVNAKNPADAQTQVTQKMNANPQLKSMNPMVNIHMENKRKSVPFTKKELNKLLMN